MNLNFIIETWGQLVFEFDQMGRIERNRHQVLCSVDFVYIFEFSVSYVFTCTQMIRVNFVIVEVLFMLIQ